MFFLCGPYVKGYSRHQTRTHKNCVDSFSSLCIVCDKRVRKMMIPRIVSMNSFFVAKHTNDISWVQTGWPWANRHQHKMTNTWLKTGCDSRSHQNKTTKDKWQKWRKDGRQSKVCGRRWGGLKGEGGEEEGGEGSREEGSEEEEGQPTVLIKGWDSLSRKSDHFVLSVVSSVQVVLHVSSDANCASGDRGLSSASGNCMQMSRTIDSIMFPSGCNRLRKEWWKKIQIHQAEMNNVIQNHFLHNHLFQQDPQENAIYSLIFQKTKIVMHANAQKITRDLCRKKSRNSRRPTTSCNTIWRHECSGPWDSQWRNESILQHRYAVVWLVNGFEGIHGKTRPHKKRWVDCSDFHFPRTILELFPLTIQWNSRKFRRLRVESEHVDSTPIRIKWIRRKGGSEE